MTLTRVLIKFMSSRPVCNVASGIALEPELMVPVGYGNFLSETMRSRYNYFFYHRRLQTVLTDPVRLERNMEPDIERRLEELLEKYADSRPVVDISDADADQAMALGSVLRAHPSLLTAVLDYRIEEGIFYPQKNADFMKRLRFPTLTAAEFRFLRSGTPFDALPDEAEDILYRKDLDKFSVRLIRSMSKVYYDRPGYWKGFAEKLRKTAVGMAPGKREYLIDASALPIRDETFEELVERGILEKYVRQNGIVNLVCGEPIVSQLLIRIDRTPLLNLFLRTALIREYDQSAAYHDLMLMDYRYVAGIRACLPVVLGTFSETGGAEEIIRFCFDAGRLFDDPVRKILVKETGLPVSGETADAAARLGVELVDGLKLEEALQPG